MIFRCLIGLAIASLVTSCSGWSSELNTQSMGNKESKACPLELKTNCYQKAMNLLLNCAQPVGDTPEQFSEDLVYCANESGKIVFFDKKLDILSVEKGESFQFGLYQDQTPCFNFKGSRKDFQIESKELGSIEVKTLDNGEVHLSCFDEESTVISQQDIEKGCVSAPGFKTLLAKKKQDDGKVVLDHFQFSFLGTGVPAEPLFKCQF